jgi:hypothetical protein
MTNSRLHTATGSTLRQFADSGMQPSAGSRPTPKMPKPLASRLLIQTKTRAPIAVIPVEVNNPLGETNANHAEMAHLV